MTLVIEIPYDLEQELSSEAAKLGLPLSEYALQVLYSRQLEIYTPKTGADLVSYWQNADLIGTHEKIEDSQRHARKLRAEAETRTQRA